MKVIWFAAIATMFLVFGSGDEARASDTGDLAAADQLAKGALAPVAFDKKPPLGTKAHCLVMGHDFTVSENTLSSVYKGKTYVFCCPGCKPQFDADPEKYIKEKK